MSEHISPSNDDRRATSPYNFIPLPKQVVPAPSAIPDNDRYFPVTERWTGSIKCKLTTKTPLYTRTALTPEFFREWSEKIQEMMQDSDLREIYSQFFHHNDQNQPVIPGTSLRGMIRSIVEIITFSKVQWVTNNRLIFRAVGDYSSLGNFYRSKLLGTNKTGHPHTHLDYPSPNVRGGYLRITREGRFIQPAKEFHNESLIHVDYQIATAKIGGFGRHRVHNVFIEPNARATSPRGNRGPGNLFLDLAITSRMEKRTHGGAKPASMEPAVLVETGQMGNYPAPHGQHSKHMHCAIYERNDSLQKSDWLPISNEMWQLYEEDCAISRNDAQKPRILKNDGDPLFYLVDQNNQLEYFGTTMMFRLPYPHTPLDFVPEELRDQNVLDLTDAIFGFVLDQKGEANKDQTRPGRVRFSDARLIDGQTEIWYSQNRVSPKILGGPKPTSFQLYLNQNEPDDHRRLKTYVNNPGETAIRGNKLYWHPQSADLDFHESQEKVDSQHTSIRPVKRDVSFTFKVSFTNLIEIELGALIWALSLGKKGHNPNYCHKLGMGKPYGLGSVQLVIDDIDFEDRELRYKTLFNEKDSGTEWCSGTVDVGKTEKSLIDVFEKYMSTVLRINNGFNQHPRIKSLLHMHVWPGPNHAESSYQDLPSYRRRKALPNILDVPLYTQDEEPAGTIPHEKKLEVGGYITAVVDFVDPSGSLAMVLPEFGEDVVGVIEKTDLKGKKYQEGTSLRCEILDIEEDDDGVVVYLRPMPGGKK